MGREDVTAGKIKQAKGKANVIVGAAKGDTKQELKGRVQKAVGKMQQKVGRKLGSGKSPRKADRW